MEMKWNEMTIQLCHLAQMLWENYMKDYYRREKSEKAINLLWIGKVKRVLFLNFTSAMKIFSWIDLFFILRFFLLFPSFWFLKKCRCTLIFFSFAIPLPYNSNFNCEINRFIRISTNKCILNVNPPCHEMNIKAVVISSCEDIIFFIQYVSFIATAKIS